MTAHNGSNAFGQCLLHEMSWVITEVSLDLLFPFSEVCCALHLSMVA